MLKVLFIAYEFPPMGGAGVQRPAKFCKYLPDFGILPTILTQTKENITQRGTPTLDESLLEDIPAEITIWRIDQGRLAWYDRLDKSKIGAYLSHLLFLSEAPALSWAWEVSSSKEVLAQSQEFDLILATAPPNRSAVLALRLGKRLNIPVVLDFRDAWTLWCMSPSPNYLHYRLNRFLEKQSLKRATTVIATSHQTRLDWANEFGDQLLDKMRVIYNGYDQEDIESAQDEQHFTLDEDPRMLIVHTGNFYYEPKTREDIFMMWYKKPVHRWLHYVRRKEDWLYRSPYFFLQGLQLLQQQIPELATRLRVAFIGRPASWLSDMLKSMDCENLVEIIDYVPHAESIAWLKRADCVLLTGAKIIGGRDYSIGGKLFEYMGLRKPILATLSDGAMKDIVSKSGLDFLADPDAPEDVAMKINALLLQHESGGIQVTPDDEFIEGFERRQLAKQLAEVLHEAAS